MVYPLRSAGYSNVRVTLAYCQKWQVEAVTDFRMIESHVPPRSQRYATRRLYHLGDFNLGGNSSSGNSNAQEASGRLTCEPVCCPIALAPLDRAESRFAEEYVHQAEGSDPLILILDTFITGVPMRVRISKRHTVTVVNPDRQ